MRDKHSLATRIRCRGTPFRFVSAVSPPAAKACIERKKNDRKRRRAFTRHLTRRTSFLASSTLLPRTRVRALVFTLLLGIFTCSARSRCSQRCSTGRECSRRRARPCHRGSGEKKPPLNARRPRRTPRTNASAV